VRRKMAFDFGIGGFAERIFAGRWIAGPRIVDAVRKSKELNAARMSAIINYLGEDFIDRKEVSSAVFTYLLAIKEIKKNRLDASISIKPTQMGLKISNDLARKNIERIARQGRKQGVFVWLDMEAPETIDDTISLYESQVFRGGVGLVIQAKMKRSEKDLKRLLKKKAVVRLVKGAYSGPAKAFFDSRDKIDRNFLLLARMLFRNSKEFTIATHDSKLIDEAMAMNRAHRRKVTFAMLNGIRNRYAATLALSGNRVAIYMPFGSRWFDYSLRRLKEKGSLLLVLRSLFGG
jgi:proline dehydrogenase